MVSINNKDEHEAILTRKMDGIAMLCAIGIKECEEKEKDSGDCVLLDYDKLGSVKVEDRKWNTQLVKLWLNPRNMHTIRKFDSKFYKISLQLFKPTHHNKALNLPHLFRMCVEDKLFELVGRMPEFVDKVAKGVTMVYRCEFMVGNEGPHAATILSGSKHWFNLSSESKEIFQDNVSERADVSKYLFKFVKFVILGQWSREWIDRNVRVVILDFILSKWVNKDRVFKNCNDYENLAKDEYEYYSQRLEFLCPG